jgi:hypothetical protein
LLIEKIFFEAICKTNVSGEDWMTQSSVERKLWEGEYDAVFDVYKAKFTESAKKWLDSPAGVHFKEDVERKRSNYPCLCFADCRKAKVEPNTGLEPRDLEVWQVYWDHSTHLPMFLMFHSLGLYRILRFY